MEDKNIIYNNNLNNHIIPNDTSHKDFAMEALQKRKEKYEQLRQDAIGVLVRTSFIVGQLATMWLKVFIVLFLVIMVIRDLKNHI